MESFVEIFALCAKNVGQSAPLPRAARQVQAWSLGKEFIAILRERALPKRAEREGAMFCIYGGELSADSDGPVEWCQPVTEGEARALTSPYPELTLRTEPSHRAVHVAIENDALPTGAGGDSGVKMRLVFEIWRDWAENCGISPESLTLTLEDLGVRITYLAKGPITETRPPYCDVAVPFALANS